MQVLHKRQHQQLKQVWLEVITDKLIEACGQNDVRISCSFMRTAVLSGRNRFISVCAQHYGFSV